MRHAHPVSRCVFWTRHDICMGCYRSAAEITDWFMATDEQKREVLRRARERMQASAIIRLI